MVSVIIPVYKVEKYLNECVDSVLAQTYSDLEVILVDDGSPDNCGAICDEYAAKDSRVKVIHKENGGLSDARNAGLLASHGEYIYFIDSDDYIRNDAIELLVKRANRENADLVYFEAESFFDGEDTSGYLDVFDRKRTYRTDNGARILAKLCRDTGYFSCVQLLFIRHSLLIDNGICFLKGIIHEDELFTPLVYLRAERAAHLHRTMYFKRTRPGSIITENVSVKSLKGSYAVIKALHEELKKYPSGSIEKQALMLAMRTKANNIIVTYAHFNKEQRKETAHIFDECLRIFKKDRYYEGRRLRISVSFLGLSSLYITKLRPILKKLQKVMPGRNQG